MRAKRGRRSGSAGPASAPLPGPVALRGNLVAALGEAESSDGAVRDYRRAWVHAAAGRYGPALSSAEAAGGRGPVAAAAAAAIRASVLRQMRLHERAEVDDRAGLDALAGGPRATDPVVADVLANLRIGLVADAVGHALGGRGATDLDVRLAQAREAVDALRRAAADAAADLGHLGVPWRQVLRLSWVEGECMLVRGDPAAAGRAFAAARRLAAARGARRHEAKSTLFLAGARAASGDLHTAGRLAAAAVSLAEGCGAWPLVWPARRILAAAAEARDAPRAAQAQRERAAVVRTRLVDSLPEPLRAEASARLEA